MKVCLICNEIFAWGKYGGFGRSTRLLGRELARRGMQVSAVVPRRTEQQPVETLDGITVLSFPMQRPWEAAELARRCDAHIYHSQEPSYSSFLAIRAMPDRRHVVTFRDPKTVRDWLIEVRYPTLNTARSLFAWYYETRGVREVVRQADAVAVCAECLAAKVQLLYGTIPDLLFLPSPIPIPERTLHKSPTPTVCFVGRWDRRKRPDLFFEVARQRPQIHFVAVGASANPRWDAELRQRYGRLPNVEMTGFLDQFAGEELSRVLERSWILMNTAAREGLPTTFLEALVHRCAILSGVNPGGFTQRFGLQVRDGNFAHGLDQLLAGDEWARKAAAGAEHVLGHYELGTTVERHLELYCRLLA